MFFCFEIISYNILKFISYPKSDSTFRNNLDFKNPIAAGLTKDEFFKTFEKRINQE